MQTAIEANGGILRAAVPVTMDGREWLLRYRAYAFIRYAEEVGHDLLVDLRDLAPVMVNMTAETMQLGVMFTRLRDIVWAGLIDAQPDTTREDVARMMDLAGMRDLLEKVLLAVRQSMPEEKARPTKATTKSAPSRTHSNTGESSGPVLEQPESAQPNSSS